MLPEPLKARAMRRARRLGISLGEFIRRSMQSMLDGAAGAPEQDPLVADDAVFEGPVPSDLSVAHDRHLYGRGR